MIQENVQLYNMIKEAGGVADAKSYLGSITRQRTRENAFHHAIQEVKPVNPSDCKRSSTSTTMVYQHWLEPESSAYVMGSRGETAFAQYISAGLAEIPFNKIQSRKFEIFTEDLLYYPFPITKVIEDNIVRDLHEAEDRYFATLSYASAAAAGSVNSYTGTFDKLAMRMLFDSISRKTLTGSTMLISDILYNQLVTHGNEFFGSALNAQVCASGYTVQTFNGRTIVQTIKNRILTRNPYAPGDNLAYSFIDTVSGEVPGAVRNNTPVDPWYTIGTNLRTQPIGGSTANGFYPAKDIYNGKYIAGFTNAVPSAANISANGFGLNKQGGALVAHVAAVAGPLGPTTNDWLGNTALCFADEEALGKSLLLRDVEFELQQRDFKLSFQARKFWGVGITNINGVSQVTLAPVL